MLKPLTLSLSLAVALGASSLSMAGGLFHGAGSGCSTCGLASEQGPAPSAQAPVVASAQSECGFAAPKKCNLFSGFHGIHFKKPHLFDVQYEWVLKKKLVWAHKGCGNVGCGDVSCAPSIMPSSQAVPSSQAYSSGQSVIPTGQAYYGNPAPYSSTPVYSAPAAPSAPAGDEAPPAPAAAPAPAPAPAPTEPPPAPAAPAANAPQTSLLFSTPSSN